MGQPGNQRRIRFMKTNENEDTTNQNLWDTAKAGPRGKFMAIQVSLKKWKKTQIRRLILNLKDLEKEQQIKPTPSRRREIISI